MRSVSTSIKIQAPGSAQAGQMTNKLPCRQAGMSKIQNSSKSFWSFGIGDWNLSGVWDFGLKEVHWILPIEGFPEESMLK